MNLAIKLVLREQFLKDVLVTICESGRYGIDYWATIGRVTKGSSSDYTAVQMRYDREADPEGLRKGRYTMTLPRVAGGIRNILTRGPKVLGLHPNNIGRVAGAVAANDAGLIDGEAADWIAQAAIFERVIYG